MMGRWEFFFNFLISKTHSEKPILVGSDCENIISTLILFSQKVN